MTLNQLRVFRTVAATKNIAMAARHLFTSPASVSMQLRALEKSLGVSLFERRRGQLILTEAAETLARYAATILQAEEEAEKDIAALTETLKGRLRIGTNLTGGMYVAPKVIRRYREQFPDVDISLSIDSSARITDAVLRGIVDVGLIGGPVDRARCEAEVVGRDELVLIASPYHPVGKIGSIPLSSLATEALILPSVGSRSRWLLESILHANGLAVRVALTMNGTEEVKKAVEATLGVGFVSRHSITHELREGTLVQVAIRDFRVERDFELFWQKERPLEQRILALVSVAKEVLRDIG